MVWLKENWFKLGLIAFIGLILISPIAANAFSFEYVNQYNYNSYEKAGFFSGTWHGMLAPYSLLVRFLTFFSYTFDIDMYAYDNTGWFYDFGFFVGILLSIPIGWLAAIIAFIALFV